MDNTPGPNYEGLLISADSHVIEPPDLWVQRLPGALQAEAPRFPRAAGPFQAQPGGWDPAQRLKEMAQDGVSAEVLYPTLALNLFHLENVALQEACFRVYNDWLVDYCQVAPDRLIGIAALSAYDIDSAIKEMERSRRRGLRGAIIWQLPPERLAFHGKHHERLWAAAQGLQMPISLHILTGHDWSRRVSTEMLSGKTFSDEEKIAMGEYGLRGLVNHKLTSAMDSLHDIVISGVLQRFPRLKLVLVENEIGWIPFVLNQWDKYYSRPTRIIRSIDRLPSDYLKGQIFATFFNDRVGCRLFGWWGTENCMWSNDYPHANSTWPNSRQVVQRDLGSLSEQARSNLAWKNTVDLYQLRVPAPLQPAATV